MYHHSDKELDRLSREAADQFDVEQSTSGWDALESMLDKELPLDERKKRRWFFFFILFTALSSGAGLVYLLAPGGGKPQMSQVAANGSLDSSSSTMNATVPQEGNNEVEGESPTQSTNFETPDKALTSNSGTDQQKTRDNPTFSTARDTEISKDRREGNVGREREHKSSLVNHNIQQPGDKRSLAFSNTRSRNKQSSITGKKSPNASLTLPYVNSDALSDIKTAWPIHAQTAFSPGSISEAAGIDSIEAAFYPEEKPANSVDEKKQPSGTFATRGLEFGIMGSPDLSSVNFSHKDKMGWNAGVTVSYRLGNRVSIQSGLIYTRKIYTANGDEYHPPKGYWTYNTQLHSVNGICDMFDIPVNIRYDLNLHPRNRFFISAGSSSYFMKEETYNYHYTYNGVYGSRERYYESDEKHFFSILNFSVGIESKLTKRFSLQLEPFFKVPVQGLGFGSVKLNSYGAYFGIRYKPFSK